MSQRDRGGIGRKTAGRVGAPAREFMGHLAFLDQVARRPGEERIGGRFRSFEAATVHLSGLEEGVLNRLLRLCVALPGGRLPVAVTWILHAVGAVSHDERRAAREMLAEFFAFDGIGFVPARAAFMLPATSRERGV